MLRIQTPRSYKTAIFAAISSLVVLASLLVSFSLFKAQALDPVTITVNTLTDEDGTGASCSIREAAQAAKTAAAYGGCTAGTGLGDTINLSIAGTYTYNGVSDSFIELNSTSLIGQSSATYILSGFDFNLTGDLAATISQVTLIDNGTTLINGSHKTYSNVVLKDTVIASYIIEDNAAVTDITFDMLTTSNIGEFNITCDNTTLCSDVAIQNSTITAVTDRVYIGTGAQANIANTTINSALDLFYYADNDAVMTTVTLNAVERAFVNIGEDSSIDDLTETTGDVAWVTVADRSTLNNIEQTSTAGDTVGIAGYGGIDPLLSVTNITQTVNVGGTTSIQVDSPIIENVTANAHAVSHDNISSAAIYNTTPDATIRNISMVGDDVTISTNAISIDTLTVSGVGGSLDGQLSLSNDNNNAVLENISVEDIDSYFNLNGNDGVLQDSTIGQLASLGVTGENFSLLRSDISGGGSSFFNTTGLMLVEDMIFTSISTIYGSMEDFTLRNSTFTLSGGPLSGTYTGDVLIDNVLFDTNSGGISVTGSGPGATLEVLHTDILNSYTTVTSGSPCTLSASGFDTMLVDAVTIDGANNACGGVLAPSGINTLTLRDVSITNNNAAALFGSGLNANITLENVIMDNNTGGVFIMGSDSTKSFTATNTILTNNFTENHGNGPPSGLEVANYANVTISGLQATGNLTPGAIGTAIVVINGGTSLSLNDVQIHGSSNGASGIAVSASTANIELSHVLVEDTFGTGINLLGKNIITSHVTVLNAGNFAAAISAVSSGAELRLSDSVFDGNLRGITVYTDGIGSIDNVAIVGTVDSYGLSMNKGESHISNVTISGGQDLDSAAVLLLEGVYTIDNMTVTQNAGGGVSVGSDTKVTDATIRNSTIARNDIGTFDPEVDQKSAGLAAIGSISDPELLTTVAVDNSLIFGNTGTAQCVEYDEGSITATYTIVSDNSCSGATQISDIDDYVGTTLGDNNSEGDLLGYHETGGLLQTLRLTSDPQNPAIGAGNPASCSEFDARGFERDVTIGCDLGSFQFNIVAATSQNPDAGTPPSGSGNGGAAQGGSGSAGLGINAPYTGELDTTKPVASNEDASDGPVKTENDMQTEQTQFNGTTLLVIVVVTIIAGVAVSAVVIRLRRP